MSLKCNSQKRTRIPEPPLSRSTSSIARVVKHTLDDFSNILLKLFIAHKAVSDACGGKLRPGRSEPRVRKRRPKAYPLMTKPRHELRKQLQTA
ncbi:hypothetical protein H1Q63_06315 [Desmonostoc muscorum CCALA 125]|nr:hypothetical protein [Desmonostoc muscorum CCALA 125]